MSGVINAALGGISRVEGAVSGVSRLVRSVSTLGRDLSSLSGSGYGDTSGLGAWADNLQPASWNGIPFAVRESVVRRGRRVAVHEFPFQDDVWVEDLSRGIRGISFSGFLVGDDVFDQRDAMLAAAELAGRGELVHPSLGSLNVVLVEPLTAGERADLGRVVELSFAFIEVPRTGPFFPTSATSTQDGVTTAAAQADAASASDFGSKVLSAVKQGASMVQKVVSTVQHYGSIALNLVNDASRVVGAVKGIGAIVGANFGRYDPGRLSTPTALAPISSTLSVAQRTVSATGSLLSGSISAVTTVRNAASNVSRLAGLL